MKKWIVSLLLGTLLCLLAAPGLHAATATITLDDVTVAECGTPWEEIGVTMWFSETTAEDIISPFCLFIADANNFGQSGVYIYPARLVVDLSGVQGLESVEIDVYETHFAGSTRAFLYSGESTVASTQSFMEDMQTLTLATGGSTVDRLAVSAQESYVFEIRLSGELMTADDAVTFSAVKARYR